MDANIFDVANLPVSWKNFTRVFANGTAVAGVPMVRCWESDLQVYEDGTVAILFEARANNVISDHRNFYSRYDGKAWKTTYIGKAGGPMYSAEEDYTGLGALCPNDPNTIYLSSPFNPGDDNSKAGKREIWRGVTADSGATWKWTPVTANSSKDNFRPIVPAWNKDNTALLWWRGTYTSAQIFNAAVVGVFYYHSVGVAPERRSALSASGPEIAITRGPQHRGVTIRYSLPEQSNVRCEVYTTSGKLAAILASGKMAAGSHDCTLTERDIRSGTYLFLMKTGEFSKVKRMMLF